MGFFSYVTYLIFFHIVNVHINKYIPDVLHIKEGKNIPYKFSWSYIQPFS